MIERLDQIVLQDFIELCCGNDSVLLVGDEQVDKTALVAHGQRLIAEYLAIASPSQAKINMIEAEDEQKLTMKERCVRICMMLCKQDHPELARSVLVELGVPSSLITTDEQVLSRCTGMLNEVQYELKALREREDEKKQNAVKKGGNIRQQWHSEIAFVMSTLKMSIDPATINTAIYANLVSRAVTHSKQMAKMPPMMGMFF